MHCGSTHYWIIRWKWSQSFNKLSTVSNLSNNIWIEQTSPTPPCPRLWLQWFPQKSHCSLPLSKRFVIEWPTTISQTPPCVDKRPGISWGSLGTIPGHPRSTHPSNGQLSSLSWVFPMTLCRFPNDFPMTPRRLSNDPPSIPRVWSRREARSVYKPPRPCASKRADHQLELIFKDDMIILIVRYSF